MSLLAALLGEHGAIGSQIDWLQTRLPEIDSRAELRAAVELLAAALSSHAELEDELLLAPLSEALGGRGPVESLQREHDEIEAGLRAVLELADLTEAKTAVRRLLHLVRHHFRREEEVLFPVAAGALSAEVLRDAAREWASRRRIRLPGPRRRAAQGS